MTGQGPQKDAMDVLQAFVDDYNARAHPAIRRGSAGEAGGAQLRLRDSPAEGQASSFPMVAVNSDIRAAILVPRFELGTLGGNESEALAVNGRGQVAGHSRSGGAGAAPKHAFVIAEPGTMIDLGSLGGATSVAHDLNDRGEVVGLAETKTGAARAFVWTGTDGMRDLGTLGAASMALGINDRTEVVGGSGHAFLWTAHGGMVDLGTLGGRTSCANAINEAGCIVGASQTGDADARGLPVTHAFLRTPEGGMLDLGTLGGAHSAAVALADEEGGTLWITGHSHDASGRMRAVLWAVRLG